MVFYCGLKMYDIVLCDEFGCFNYWLVVIWLFQIDFDDVDVFVFVVGIVESIGEFLEIVNFNLCGL